MGMFSWKCKGCGHELIMGESVRLNGVKQEYNGYGGLCDEGRYNQPSAWHDLCYLAATPEQRHDNEPSERAPNQGFGPAKLEFMPGYIEDAPTTYVAILSACYENVDQKYIDLEYFYTTNNKLEDEKSHSKQYRQEQDKLTFEESEESDLESQEYWKNLDDKIKAIIGPSPAKVAKVFDSMNEAIAAVDAVLSRDLPSECKGCYHLLIEGRQQKARGSVYERSADNYDDEYNELKEVKTNITYHWKLEVDESTKLQKLIAKIDKQLLTAQLRHADSEAKLNAITCQRNELLNRLNIADAQVLIDRINNFVQDYD